MSVAEKNAFQRDLHALMKKHDLGELTKKQTGPFVAGLILGSWMTRRAMAYQVIVDDDGFDSAMRKQFPSWGNETPPEGGQ